MSERERLAARLREMAPPGQAGDRERILAHALENGSATLADDEAIAEAKRRLSENQDNGASSAAGEEVILPPPTAPMTVARELAALHYTDPSGMPILRHWRGGWWEWRSSHWAEVEHRAVRASAYAFTEHASYWKETKEARGITPWAPNRHRIADFLEALAAVCHLPEAVAQPGWIEGSHDGVIVACANGLLDVRTRTLLDHDPRFFNQTAVPFAYDPDASAPGRWLRFLTELWPEDPHSIAALQEWFGYVISGRLDLHKILLLVGPTRAGKGVIARVLGA